MRFFCYIEKSFLAIRKMEPAWVKVNGGNFSLVEYKDKKGELRLCYSLTKTECTANCVHLNLMSFVDV